jgi:chromosome segregation ATPase
MFDGFSSFADSMAKAAETVAKQAEELTEKFSLDNLQDGSGNTPHQKVAQDAASLHVPLNDSGKTLAASSPKVTETKSASSKVNDEWGDDWGDDEDDKRKVKNVHNKAMDPATAKLPVTERKPKPKPMATNSTAPPSAPKAAAAPINVLDSPEYKQLQSTLEAETAAKNKHMEEASKLTEALGTADSKQQQEASNLRKRVEELEADKKKLEKKSSSAVESQQREVSNLRQRVEELEAEIAEVSGKYEEACAAKAAALKSFKSQESKKKQEAKMQKELLALKKVNEDLSSQLAALERPLEHSVGTGGDDKDDGVEAAQLRLEGLVAQLKEEKQALIEGQANAEAQTQALREELELAVDAVRASEESKAALKDSLQTKLDTTMAKARKQQKEETNAATERHAELSAQVQALEEQLSKARKQQEEETNAATEHHAELSAQVQALEQRLEAATASGAASSAQAAAQLTETEAKLSEQSSALQQAESKCQQTEQRCQQVEQEAAAAAKRLRALEGEASGLRSQLQGAESGAGSSKKEIWRLKGELIDTQRLLERRDAEMRTSDTAQAMLQTLVDERDTELAASSAEVAELRVQLGDVQAQLAYAQAAQAEAAKGNRIDSNVIKLQRMYPSIFALCLLLFFPHTFHCVPKMSLIAT